MNERPMGGSAYDDGRIEFMIQRKLYYDDNLGVAEPLIDNTAV